MNLWQDLECTIPAVKDGDPVRVVVQGEMRLVAPSDESRPLLKDGNPYFEAGATMHNDKNDAAQGYNRTGEFTCCKCGQRVWAAVYQSPICAGCAFLETIVKPENREAMRQLLVERGLIGQLVNSPVESILDVAARYKEDRYGKFRDPKEPWSETLEPERKTNDRERLADVAVNLLYAAPTPEMIEAAAGASFEVQALEARKLGFKTSPWNPKEGALFIASARAAIATYRKLIGAAP